MPKADFGLLGRDSVAFDWALNVIASQRVLRMRAR
jgi:hypothetical protein